MLETEPPCRHSHHRHDGDGARRVGASFGLETRAVPLEHVGRGVREERLVAQEAVQLLRAGLPLALDLGEVRQRGQEQWRRVDAELRKRRARAKSLAAKGEPAQHLEPECWHRVAQQGLVPLRVPGVGARHVLARQPQRA